MSSEDLKKQHMRTQGKYSDSDLMKNRDKKYKISPSAKDGNDKRVSKRHSNESKKSNSFLSEESSSVKYEKNSDFSFNELEEPQKPTVISDRGKHSLGTTENGESKIYYQPSFFCKDEAWEMFERLSGTTNWHDKNIVIRGEEYPQPRLVAWYGPYPYSYSGTTLEPAEMPDFVVEIKERIEKYLREEGINTEFNSVLLNLYRNEKDSVAWHSDDESTMGIRPTIASVSLGEVRKFEIRPKDVHSEESERTIFMNHGSLIIMDGCMQLDWLHRVPKEYHEKNPRINLTFRTVFPIDKSPQLPVKESNKQCEVSNKTKTANSDRTIEFDDKNFPALSSVVKPSSLAVKNNGNIGRTTEVWDTDTSVDDKQRVQNWVFDNNSQDKEKIVSEDENSDEGSNIATGLVSAGDITEREFRNSERDLSRCVRELEKEQSDRDPPKGWQTDNLSNRQSNERIQSSHIVDDKQKVQNWVLDNNGQENEKIVSEDENSGEITERDFKNSERDLRFRLHELEKKRSDRDPPKGWRTDNLSNRHSNERLRSSHIDDTESRWRHEENKTNGRHSRRYTEDRPFRNSVNDDTRKKQMSGEHELRRDRRDETYEVPRGQWRKDRNDRFAPSSQAINKRHERFPRDDEQRGKNFRMQYDDNRCDRISQRRDGNRKYERKGDPLPPRHTKRYPSRCVSDENPPDDCFDNDKHASELVKKEHPTSDVGKEQSKNFLNVEAKEFVPGFLKPVYQYDQLTLEDLLPYKIDLMAGERLQIYAHSLKCKVEENFEKFNEKEKEELNFLCALTDGSQSNKNQKLISIKTVAIVTNCLNRINSS